MKADGGSGKGIKLHFIAVAQKKCRRIDREKKVKTTNLKKVNFDYNHSSMQQARRGA